MEAEILSKSNRSITWQKNVLRRIDSLEISDTNKRLIRDFQSYLFSTGSKETRVAKVSSQLQGMLLFNDNGLRVLDEDLNRVSRKEIMTLVSYINRIEQFSEATKSDYRRCLKQFYRWFKEEDERVYGKDDNERIKAQKLYHYIEKEVRRAYKERQIDPSSVLTEEDIEVVASTGCRSIKEKAFIKFLHETGVRAEEMLNLKIKHIQLKKNIGVAHVDGKTGRRTVQFTKSMPYIVQWLGIHPCRDIPEAFLWLGESSNRLYERLIYRGAIKLVSRVFKKAGVKKRHNLHWFRHSRASLLAPHLTESLLCRYMGWTLGSKQVKTYLHLCPQQLEDAFLRMNGLEEQEEKKDLPQKCGCGVINDRFARYCFQCGNPLNVGVVIQDQEILKQEIDDRLKVYAEIMSDPVKKAKFEEFKRIFLQCGTEKMK